MDFALPELGEGVYEAELVRWLVAPGDTVKHGQSLMEVMTDKATMEVPSPFEGTIHALNAQPGQQIKIGSVVLSYDGSMVGSGAATASAPAATKRATTAEPARNGPAAASTTVKAAPSV